MKTLLYRRGLMEPYELAAAARHFRVTDTVVGIEWERDVVARYRAVPYYDEVVRDLGAQGSTLINSQSEHSVVASFEWYNLLSDLTPKSWFRLHDVPKDGGPFVVKGAVNSKKEQWRTSMYAQTFSDAIRVAGVLQEDRYIANQPVVVREYIPLVCLEESIGGLPFANEWRVFAYRGVLLAWGYYWSGAEDESKARARLSGEGLTVAREAAARLADHVPFTAIDVAETVDGRWIVVEVNDGQMSGLSDVDPEELYSSLARALANETHRRSARG